MLFGMNDSSENPCLKLKANDLLLSFGVRVNVHAIHFALLFRALMGRILIL